MGKLQEPILGKFPKSVSISNSEIQTFKRCRRRWYLGTYRGLKEIDAAPVGALALGNRVHAALEAYYRDDINPVEEYERLQRRDNRLFEASKKAQYESEREKFKKEAELGRLMLEGFMDWLDEENADATIEVVGVEDKISYRLNEFDPRVELIGKVDLRVRRAFDGTLAAFDHKTAATFNDYWSMSNFSEQLMTYTLIQRLSKTDPNERIDGGIYNLLKKVKRTAKATPPFYDRIDVRFNNKTIESFWIRLLGTIRDIMAVRDALDNGADHRYVAYPTQKMDWTCSSCPFFNVCDMLDDGSAAEAMIDDLYEQEDPNSRYDDPIRSESY